jgi:hypothetical protein
MTRRIVLDRLTVSLPAGTHLDPRALTAEIARALAAGTGAAPGSLAVAADAPRRGEAPTAAARRIAQAVAARTRGGDAG